MVDELTGYKLFFTVFNDFSSDFSREIPPGGFFGYAFALKEDQVLVKSWKRPGKDSIEISGEVPLEQIAIQVLEGFPHPKFAGFLESAGFSLKTSAEKRRITRVIRELLEELE